MSGYIDMKLCTIEVNDGKKILYDEEGNIEAKFPDRWLDSDIHVAVDLANKAYELGRKIGMQIKVLEIKRTLEIL